MENEGARGRFRGYVETSACTRKFLEALEAFLRRNLYLDTDRITRSRAALSFMEGYRACASEAGLEVDWERVARDMACVIDSRGRRGEP